MVKKGIASTLYDPRINASQHDERPSLLNLQTKLKEIDNRIGFTHIINSSNFSTTSTKYGEFIVGSPLSYQLTSVDFDFTYETNITANESAFYSQHPFISLPLEILSENHAAYPSDWELAL